LCKTISLRNGTTPRWLSILLLFALGSGAAISQESAPAPNGPADGAGPPRMEGRRPPMGRAFHMGPPGRWWNNPDFVKKLSLTPDQQKKMEAVFEQSRPSLMDLSAMVRKEEMAMEALLSADQPDEGKTLAQIDRLVQARAELEKSYARMLLGLRRVLTPDQWKILQADDARGHFSRFGPGLRGDYGSPPPSPPN
jgi:Spy/CpxP family protein refolding chaperone